jgi:hypothetical protein
MLHWSSASPEAGIDVPHAGAQRIHIAKYWLTFQLAGEPLQCRGQPDNDARDRKYLVTSGQFFE